MTKLLFALSACLAASAVSARPAVAGVDSPVIEHLQNIETDEATLVVSAVAREQTKLRRGEETYFHLFSGAPASYDQNNVGPREHFIALDLSKIWRVKRLSRQGEIFPEYELTVTPKGLEHSMWKLNVQMGWTDKAGYVERVTMFYGPPPPL